jgi:hypothetical protein
MKWSKILTVACLMLGASCPIAVKAGCSGWSKVGIAQGYYMQKHGVEYSPEVAAKLCGEDEGCQETLRIYCPE